MLLLLMAFCPSNLSAQDSLHVVVDHAMLPKTDTIVEVRVLGSGAPTFVGFQTSMVWAESELELEAITFGPVLADFNNGSNLVTAGELRVVSFLASNNLPEGTFAQDSLLFTLRFKTLPGFSGNTPIFSSQTIGTEFTASTNNLIPFSLREGYVSYGGPNMLTRFEEPYADQSTTDQFCVDLVADEATAIAGFDLDLQWDNSIFTLNDVRLGDNPLALSMEEVSFAADQLSFSRQEDAQLRFPAVLSPTTVASLCFTTSDPDATSNLTFGGRSGNLIYGYAPTGEVVVATDSQLDQGTISQPKGTSIFGPAAALPALKVYPNPATDLIRLEGLDVAQEWELTVWDELGRLVRQENTYGATLDLSTLVPGTYTLGAVQGEKRWLNRIVVTTRP